MFACPLVPVRQEPCLADRWWGRGRRRRGNGLVIVGVVLVGIALLAFLLTERTADPTLLTVELPTPTVGAPDKPEFKIDANTVVIPTRKIEGEAVVLAVKKFSDQHAALMPYQLFIGWGPMSVYDNFKGGVLGYSALSGRVANANWPDHPPRITEDQYQKSVANIYVIPGDPFVLKALGRLRRYERIRFSGFLVDLATPLGRITTSSSLDEFRCKYLYFDRIETVPR